MLETLLDLLALHGEGVTPEEIGDCTVTVQINGTGKMVSFAFSVAAPAVVVTPFEIDEMGRTVERA
jgi:hypothetical protein